MALGFERRKPGITIPEENLELARELFVAMDKSSFWFLGRDRARRVAANMSIVLERPKGSRGDFRVEGRRNVRTLQKVARFAIEAKYIPGANHVAVEPVIPVLQELATANARA